MNWVVGVYEHLLRGVFKRLLGISGDMELICVGMFQPMVFERGIAMLV